MRIYWSLCYFSKFYLAKFYLQSLPSRDKNPNLWRPLVQNSQDFERKKQRKLILEMFSTACYCLGAILKPRTEDSLDKPKLRRTLPLYSVNIDFVGNF